MNEILEGVREKETVAKTSEDKVIDIVEENEQLHEEIGQQQTQQDNHQQNIHQQKQNHTEFEKEQEQHKQNADKIETVTTQSGSDAILRIRNAFHSLFFQLPSNLIQTLNELFKKLLARFK